MGIPQRWDKMGYSLESRLHELIGYMTERPFETDEGWENLTRQFFALHQDTKLEADDAARHLSEKGVFPETLSSGVAYILIQRIQCALDFLGMAFPPKSDRSPFGEVPPSWRDGSLIEWLLIDLWERRHDNWLKLVAIELCGPFPFYGLEPADPNVPA